MPMEIYPIINPAIAMPRPPCIPPLALISLRERCPRTTATMPAMRGTEVPNGINQAHVLRMTLNPTIIDASALPLFGLAATTITGCTGTAMGCMGWLP